MILSLFAWAKITNQGRLCPEKITIFEEKHKKEQNISFILFASEESKIHFEIPSTIGNARSKKFSNCTTTRLRWNSPKFLGTISYEISWSTTKTKFYTRKISIFSVDLVTEWGYESDPSGQTAGLEVSEVWRCTLAHRKELTTRPVALQRHEDPLRDAPHLVPPYAQSRAAEWFPQQLAPNLQGC